MNKKMYCPECGKQIKFKRNAIGIDIPVPCQCIVDKANRERAARINAGYENIRLKIFSENGVGKKFSGITLDNITSVFGQEKAYNKALEFAARYKTDKNSLGFGLCGGVGSGKTYITAALVNQICNYTLDALTDEEKEKAHFGRFTVTAPALLISSVELFEKLKYNAAEKSDSGYMRRIKRAKVLVIDDLGAARVTEWAAERLFEIIDYRYVEELPTIYTTNVLPKELKSIIGERTIDRLTEMCEFVSVSAQSQRKPSFIKN